MTKCDFCTYFEPTKVVIGSIIHQERMIVKEQLNEWKQHQLQQVRLISLCLCYFKTRREKNDTRTVRTVS